MLTSMPSPFAEAVKCPSFTLNFLERVECANRPLHFHKLLSVNTIRTLMLSKYQVFSTHTRDLKPTSSHGTAQQYLANGLNNYILALCRTASWVKLEITRWEFSNQADKMCVLFAHEFLKRVTEDRFCGVCPTCYFALLLSDDPKVEQSVIKCLVCKSPCVYIS